MTKQSVDVTIDIHELEGVPQFTDLAKNHPDVDEWEVEKLPAADIEVAGVGFERKTVSDYASSLQKGRIDEQTEKMDQRYEHAYVLIDGDAVETDAIFGSGMDGHALRGSWASLTAREDSGVHAVIPCSNPTLLFDMAVRHARKHIEESDREFIPEPDVGIDADTTEMMYACISGVGPTLAEKLKERYPTMKEFIHNADYYELQKVDGIGEEKAIEIVEAML